MAVTITPIVTGPNSKTWGVTATADGDTNATIAHGFGSEPRSVHANPAQMHTQATAPQWWCTPGAANLAFVKANTAGSGKAGVQLLVYASRPHTLVR